jgi:hypothetical protein
LHTDDAWAAVTIVLLAVLCKSGRAGRVVKTPARGQKTAARGEKRTLTGARRQAVECRQGNIFGLKGTITDATIDRVNQTPSQLKAGRVEYRRILRSAVEAIVGHPLRSEDVLYIATLWYRDGADRCSTAAGRKSCER